MVVRHIQIYTSKCVTGVDPEGVSEVPRKVSLEDGQDLECVEEFCYLGDMIGAGGGLERQLERE